MMSGDLERLYRDAKLALKARDYERASEWLRQILLVDENYKDASRLLAQAVKLRRRRWYGDVRVWGVAAVVLLAATGLGLGLSLRASNVNPTPSPLATAVFTETPEITPPPTVTARLAAPIWRRVSMGEGFARDRITALVFNPQDPEVIYVGLENAGVYKSIDGGISWQPSHEGMERTAVYSLAIDPVDPRVLYAGVRMGRLYKTTNGGQTWSALEGAFDLRIKDIASIVLLDPRDHEHVLYTTAFALYESSDGGRGWKQIQAPRCPEVMGALMLDPVNSRRLFAVDIGGKCENGVYVSEDGGLTWSLLAPADSAGSVHLAGDSTGQYLYAAVSDGALQTSQDGGATWTKEKQPPCAASTLRALAGGTALCAQDSRVMQTTDGGKSWGALGEAPSAGKISVLAVWPGLPSSLLAAGNGLSISTDGGQAWQDRSSGLASTRVEIKLVPGDESSMYIEQVLPGCKGPPASSDRGLSWYSLEGDYPGCDLQFDAGGQTRYLTMPTMHGNRDFMRSTDSGETWQKMPFPVVARGNARVLAHPLMSGAAFWVPDDPREKMLFSYDSGTTWHMSVSTGSLWSVQFYASAAKPNLVYGISPSFLDPDRSEDGGQSWKPCLSQMNENVQLSTSASRAVVDPRNADRLLLATQGQGVFRSDDGCRSWQPSSAGLHNRFVNSLAIDARNPDRVYAGTDGGAYFSDDGGQTWSPATDGLLGATVVYSVVVYQDGGVYAATPYGIFRLEYR